MRGRGVGVGVASASPSSAKLLLYYYATFLGLRQECHSQNLLETWWNLDQFLSTSDAIWLVSDQFEVLTYWGGDPLLTVPSNFPFIRWSGISSYAGHKDTIPAPYVVCCTLFFLFALCYYTRIIWLLFLCKQLLGPAQPLKDIRWISRYVCPFCIYVLLICARPGGA
jgi:hypothetical protein